jgi:acyl carrier protein
MTDAIKKIMSQIFEVDQASIIAESSPETIDRWDSLKHMQLVLALEEEFGFQFPDEMIADLIRFDVIEKSVWELTR